MKLSPQQAVVLDFVRNGRGNAIIEAVAGAGKTTTLVEICKIIDGDAVFCAYNKKIADEIGARLAAARVGRHVRSATFHALGFGAWRRVCPSVRVDGKKMSVIVENLNVPEALRPFVTRLASLAKQSAVGVLWREDDVDKWEKIVDHYDVLDALAIDALVNEDDALAEGIKLARRVVQQSIALDTEVIDFDDMLFAPLTHNARMWQNDWVLIDEAQDTNPARRALAKKMLRPGGRLIAVGDPHQAIYGFTGADNDALDIIAREFNCTRLPLTVTFRCPKSVVAHARNWVSHITAHDSAPDGTLLEITEAAFNSTAVEQLRPGDAILCRNTKPLVELAFFLIRRRVRCHVEGRDIGTGLMSLANRWRRATTIGKLRVRLTDHLDKQTERYMARGQEDKAASLADRVDTLLAIMASLHDDDPVSELHKVIDSLFSDTEPGVANDVTLSTVHKSKGREWDRVYLLGRNRHMPSKYARQDWQIEQENNLIYVAVTRARRELIEVIVEAPKKKK